MREREGGGGRELWGGSREGRRKGGKDRGREGRRDVGKDRRRKGKREGGKEGGMVGRTEGGREGECTYSYQPHSEISPESHFTTY